jgi:hypothetical protein
LPSSVPKELLESSPAAVPRFTQSSNISSSPSGGLKVMTSGGSIVELELARAKLDAASRPKPDGFEGRRTMALSGEAMPDSSHPIRDRDDLVTSIVSWAQNGKPTGAFMEHIRTRACAIGTEAMLPSDFRGTAKLALGALRRN